MCLDNVTQDSDPTQEGEGYKVFRKLHNGELRSLYCFITGDAELYQFPTNTWIADTSSRILYAETQQPYETGFHLFANKEDAEVKCRVRNEQYGFQHTVRKVKYRNVTAKGIQELWTDEKDYRSPAIVAREIFVQEEEE